MGMALERGSIGFIWISNEGGTAGLHPRAHFGHGSPYGWLPWFQAGRLGYGPSFTIEIPLWVPWLAILFPTLWLWCFDRRHAPGLCQRCGYDLSGNTTGVCPECGKGAPA